MKRFIQRLINRLPLYEKDIWYNISNNISERKYPVIFDENGRYINCKIGLSVLMGRTKSGKGIYYKVVKMWRTSGGDWLYDTDAINCNLKFHKIQ